MRINVATRLKPVVHRPGASCLIPGSPFVATCYPGRVEVTTLDGSSVGSFTIVQPAPITSFTMQQDLERGGVHIWGGDPYFRLLLSPLTSGAQLEVIKGEVEIDHPRIGSGDPLTQLPSGERLVLGVNKVLDWDLVVRRGDLREILPVWLRLGEISPKASHDSTDSMLASGDLDGAWRAGFSRLMVPSVSDRFHQGYTKPAVGATDALALLSEGRNAIRALFVHEESGNIHLLPKVMSKHWCGRFVDIALGSGKLDIEWTKSKMRRAIFRPSEDADTTFHFNQDVKRCRLRINEGVPTSLDHATTFAVCNGDTVYLDRFEK